MDVDLELVRSFLVLVREQDQRRAARRLCLTASGLSKRIDRLELQLGVQLTVRTSDGVQVSAAGRRFAPHAAMLLEQAGQARSAARGAPRGSVLRVGVPAGHTGDLVASEDMRRTRRVLRRMYPTLTITCEEIPFHSIRHCLPDERVDVLWTCAGVRHAAVDSYPLPWTTDRVAVFGDRHPLADAPSITVADVMDEVIGFNPLIPAEWMEPFWLGDLRPRPAARLVDIDARVYDDVMRHARHMTTALVMTSNDVSRLPSGTRAVPLADAPLIVFHVAKRAADRRPEVDAMVAQLRDGARSRADSGHLGTGRVRPGETARAPASAVRS